MQAAPETEGFVLLVNGTVQPRAPEAQFRAICLQHRRAQHVEEVVNWISTTACPALFAVSPFKLSEGASANLHFEAGAEALLTRHLISAWTFG